MFDEKTMEMGRLMFLLDVLFTVIAFFTSYWLRSYFYLNETLNLDSHVALLPLLLTFIIGFLSHFGAYEGPCQLKMVDYAWAIFRAIVLGVCTLLVVLFLFKIQYVSRLIVVCFLFIEFIMIVGIRFIIKGYFVKCTRDGKSSVRVLIIGTGERAKELSRKLREQSNWGIDVIGHLDPDSRRKGQTILGTPVIGTIGDISGCLKKNVVDEVIIAIPRSLLGDVEQIARACEEEGIKLRFMADVFNLQVARMRLIHLGVIPLLTMEPVAQDELKLLAKRCFDLFLTILSMPLVLPIMGIVALAIKYESPGPAFFVQQRVGLKKRLFPMFKFRSMHVNAEEMLKDIEHLNEAEGPIFKIENDPRVTRVGRFIRKTSIDELPQLFNVLRGEMSLVGPRPMSIRDVDLFDAGIQRKRFSVKPGLTCLWQISGRSNLPFKKWLELDLKYIEKWSLWLDTKILLKTIPAVFLSRGAV